MNLEKENKLKTLLTLIGFKIIVQSNDVIKYRYDTYRIISIFNYSYELVDDKTYDTLIFTLSEERLINYLKDIFKKEIRKDKINKLINDR